MTKTYSMLFLAVGLLAAPPIYKMTGKIKVGGGTRWDYAFLDSANHRLYASHGTQTEVIDTASDKVVGTIPDTKGVHGVALAPDLGRGYTSDGADNDVTVFDLKTLNVITKIKTGQNPDSIIYEPVSHRVFTFNGKSSDSTAIDAKASSVISSSIPLGGKPEFAQVDGKGHIYANIENKSEIVEIDARNAVVTKRYSIAPCDAPSGLVYDGKKGHLYSVCENKMMVASDPVAGSVLSTAPIGGGCDGVAFDDGYIFSANGGDGTVTMATEGAGGKLQVVSTITTQRGARTIASDPKAHKLYLPAAEYGPAAEAKEGKKGRPQPLPDSFEILIVSR